MVALNVTEDDTFEICRRYDMLSPLYDLGITRDGCWFCPSMNKIQIQLVKQNYPELMKEIYHMITMCDYDISRLYYLNTLIKDFMDTRGFVPRPLTDEEIKKKNDKKMKKILENNQISLFDNERSNI